MTKWSKWQAFPNPNICGYLSAPFGKGVYEVRNKKTGEMILFGIGNNVAHRMSSLLHKPLGCGTRKNTDKRDYCTKHLSDLEYRTMPCEKREDAAHRERRLKKSGKHLFQD